jgi:predicted negative regulator of RcsB-dependent stress response
MVEEASDTPRPLAEISHGPSAFEAFLDRNQKGMIVLGIALVAGTAGWIVFSGLKEGAEKSAGAALSKAEALPELQELVKSQPGTAAAGSARLLVAAKQWEAGEQDAAIETLRDFIATAKAHPALPTARASLASRLMQQGKNEEAATLFRELADAPEAKFIAPYALISLGDLAKAAGKPDEAEQSYKRVQENFADSPLASLAAQHLRMLRFKAPTEIEAPPAPAEGEAPKPEAAAGAALPQELEGNPLGGIIGGEVAVPPPAEAPAPPAGTAPAAPTEAAPASPAGEAAQPPAGGESN